MLKDTDDSAYKVGQVWTYQTRPNEENSILIIVKVENDTELGNIIHINLQGLKVKSPYKENDFLGNIDHLPIAEEVLAKSLLAKVKDVAELPEYKRGYKEWRQAFDAGKAGIWKLPVAECVAVIEEVINNNPKNKRLA